MRSVGVLTVTLGALPSVDRAPTSGVSDYLQSMHPSCNVGLNFAGGQFSTNKDNLCHVDTNFKTVGFELKDGTSIPFDLRIKGDDSQWKPYTVSLVK